MLNLRLLFDVRPILLPAGVAALLTFAAQGAGIDAEDPGTEGDGSYTVGPDYKMDPDLTDRGNPKGKSFEFLMPLADSKIFRGDDKTLDPVKKPVRTGRKITVYIPAAYHDGAKAPFLIIHDGPGPLGLVRNALDNLAFSTDPNRRLPVFVATPISYPIRKGR